MTVWKEFKKRRSQKQLESTPGTFSHPVRMSRGSDKTYAIKSGGAPAVAMHFDAAIMREVTYASLPSLLPIYPPIATYLPLLPCPAPPFLHPVLPHFRQERGIPPEFLNAFFDAVRRTIAGIFPRGCVEKWKREGIFSVTPRRGGGGETGEDNVSGKRSTAAQMYSAAEGFPGNLILSRILSRITLRSR